MRHSRSRWRWYKVSDIISELAKDEGVVFSISGLGCDVDSEDEVQYLAHTIRWLRGMSMLARCLAPRKTMKDVNGMRYNGFGSCGERNGIRSARIRIHRTNTNVPTDLYTQSVSFDEWRPSGPSTPALVVFSSASYSSPSPCRFGRKAADRSTQTSPCLPSTSSHPLLNY